MKNEYIKLLKKISNDKNAVTEIIYKGKNICQRLDQM